MNANINKHTSRMSGIEALKILMMFLIVINHVTQTVGKSSGGYYLNLERTVFDVEHIVLGFMRHFGAIGNNVFIICSIWFMEGNGKHDKNKVMQMLIDIWVISVFFLFIVSLAGFPVSIKEIIKSIFPNIFMNNWFVTCYILLYLIHPYLDCMIDNIDEYSYKRLTICLFVFYYLIGSIIPTSFFSNQLILFLVEYLIIVYIKKYVHIRFSSKVCVDILLSSLCILTMGLILVNILGEKIAFLEDKALIMKNNQNVFIFLIALSLFLLFLKIEWKNEIVNKCSKYSLFVYIIHDNILVREYVRPFFFERFFTGGSYIVFVLLFSIILFIFSFVLAMLYVYIRDLCKWPFSRI